MPETPLAKILLIDSDAISRKLVMLVLQHAGHHVVAATDAGQGAELARRHKPLLVLMGIGPHNEHDARTARELKADPLISGVRVHALVARKLASRRAHLLEAGFDGVLGKPLNHRELYRHVLAALRGRG